MPKAFTWNQSKSAGFSSSQETSNRFLIGRPRLDTNSRSRGHRRWQPPSSHPPYCPTVWGSRPVDALLSLLSIGPHSPASFPSFNNVKSHYLLCLFCPILCSGQEEARKKSLDVPRTPKPGNIFWQRQSGGDKAPWARFCFFLKSMDSGKKSWYSFFFSSPLPRKAAVPFLSPLSQGRLFGC